MQESSPGSTHLPPLVLVLLQDYARWYEKHRNDVAEETLSAGGWPMTIYVRGLPPAEIVRLYLIAVESHTNG